MHLPKCAGTSLDEVLRASFQPGEICPDRHDTLAHHAPDAIRRWRYFAGHFSKYSVDAVPGPKRVVTVLREPRARILSLYHFWRSHKPEAIERLNLRGPRLARQLGLADFLNSPEVEIVVAVRNYMVRAMIGPLPIDGTAGFRLDDPHFAVDTALENLKRMSFVAFADTLEEDGAVLTAMLGLGGAGPVERRNTFEGLAQSAEFERIEREEPSEEAHVALNRLTLLDRPFYRRARALRHTLRCPYPL